MGTVWEAYDEDLRRNVAVKEVLLPPGIPASIADELRERTMREARAIAVLPHPNVVTLHDVARENGEPFVVMELVPGRSLAQHLDERGPLTIEQAAVVADAVASALQAAHAAGITHRDVKPGNVLIAEDGRIKLTDFGISRNVAEQTITHAGIMLGSPAYIAPEVASGKGVTPGADLWGLGATLFAALEGRPPYDAGGEVMATVTQVVNGDVPVPTSAGPLTEVITGLMVKDPARRMSLVTVRQRIYPYLPQPGNPVFAPERMASADTVPAAAPVRGAPPEGPSSADAAGSARDNAPLAPAPGPLPFTPTRPVAPPAGRGRGAIASAVTLVTALLLFLATAAGGFALARIAGGRPLLPPPQAAQQDPGRDAGDGTGDDASATPSAGPMTQRADDAAKDAPGGEFTIQIPGEWRRFVEERTAGKGLPSGTRVAYVSPDGRYELVVERFPGFYPGHTIASYRQSLSATWQQQYKESGNGPLSTPVATGPEPARKLEYRTVEADARRTETRRTTFAHAIPVARDLWVVSMTVPTEGEDTAQDQWFKKIAPTFAVTG